MTLISIITGDIVKSRSVKDSDVWMALLKKALKRYISDASKWNIYRGDSFQLELSDITESFIIALYIKASIKTIKGLDVRLAVGIGEKTFSGQTVVESNGEAFQYSGETLETLKNEKVNLKIKTSHEDLDKELNLYFKFALSIMDHWTVNDAEIVKLVIEYPEALQEELGKKIGINQNAVSTRLKRAQIDLIMQLDQMFRQKIKQLA